MEEFTNILNAFIGNSENIYVGIGKLIAIVLLIAKLVAYIKNFNLLVESIDIGDDINGKKEGVKVSGLVKSKEKEMRKGNILNKWLANQLNFSVKSIKSKMKK